MKEFDKVISKHSSNNSINHYFDITKLHSKLSRKANQNEYTRIRDLITIGLKMVSTGLHYIPNVPTNEKGRKDLYELKQDILKAFELENK